MMRGSKVDFDRVPLAPKSLFHLGGLVFDKRKELGPRAFFDLTDEPDFQFLARDFIASLYQYVKPDHIVQGSSVSSYGKAIKDFIEFCRESSVPHDLRMSSVDFEMLLSFRTHVRLSRADAKGGTRRRVYGNLQRLLQAGQEIDLAHPDLVAPRNLAHGHGDVTQPYSASDALALEDVCRTDIRALEARLQKGKDLLALGADPRIRKWERDPEKGTRVQRAKEDRPWNQLTNLLWYVVNVMDGRCLSRAQMLAQKHSSFVNAISGAIGGPFRKPDVYSHLYVLAEDLIPFIVLLAKKTGRNESSILTLRRDCLEQIGGRNFLWYDKDRGGARRYRKPIDDDGPFSPVQLIRTLQACTEPLVRLAQVEHQEFLLLGLSVKGHGRCAVKPLDPAYIKAQMNRHGGWCDRRNLRDEHERPLKVSLRRLRVYYLSRKYRSHGQLGKVSRDAAHTLASTTVGYLNNDSTRHIHELSVQAGIQSARHLARVSVIPTDNPVEAAAVLKVDVAQAAGVLSGEQDVLFASCKDFYNRPDGPSSTPCSKPWECLLCPNAVITRHVLPRVMAFMKFMEGQREELSSLDWERKFERSWSVLTHDILPKFSGEVIAEAERRLRTELLYLPIHLKG